VTILAVTGLLREQRLIAGPGVEVVVGGGDHRRLETTLDRLAPGKGGIISIGIAGGLAPGLRPGQWVVASSVSDGEKLSPTDPEWTERLAGHLPGALTGVLLGYDAIVPAATWKLALYRATGALTVDMESHIAVRVAAKHQLPFAACRVVCDPAEHDLPAAARVAMSPDGGVNVAAVLGSLLTRPWQLPALVRTGLDAERAFRALLGGCRRLGPGLAGADLG
jgi:hopanoid-associated phosphorylase